jgi:hypothetical protein
MSDGQGTFRVALFEQTQRALPHFEPSAFCTVAMIFEETASALQPAVGYSLDDLDQDRQVSRNLEERVPGSPGLA